MVGVVMPHGVLFQGGAEWKIRRGIVEADLFEAVIDLARNLFSGSSMPVVICVMNRTTPSPAPLGLIRTGYRALTSFSHWPWGRVMISPPRVSSSEAWS